MFPRLSDIARCRHYVKREHENYVAITVRQWGYRCPPLMGGTCKLVLVYLASYLGSFRFVSFHLAIVQDWFPAGFTGTWDSPRRHAQGGHVVPHLPRVGPTKHGNIIVWSKPSGPINGRPNARNKLLVKGKQRCAGVYQASPLFQSQV